MKKYKKGFTLIELLVVVLIIGILAAIALPQYNKSVMKSRFAALKPIAKSVKDAQEIYFNREGQYAGESQLGDLDVGIPEGTSLDISATGDHLYVRANNPTGLPHNSYTMYLNQSGNYAGNIYCEAYTGDTVAENLCVNEGGTAGPTNGSYTLYLLSGNSTGSFGLTGEEVACSAPSKHNGETTCTKYMLNDGQQEVEVSVQNNGSSYYHGQASAKITICEQSTCTTYHELPFYGMGGGPSTACNPGSCNNFLCVRYPELCSVYIPDEYTSTENIY